MLLLKGEAPTALRLSPLKPQVLQARAEVLLPLQLPESSPTPGGEQALQDEGCGHSELGGQGGAVVGGTGEGGQR